MRRLSLSLLFTYILFFKVSAQTDSTAKQTHSYIEVGSFLSTSNTIPFWLRANQYGIVPDKGAILLTARGGYFREYNQLKPKKYDWGYGIDAVINLGAENKIYLPEAYLKVKLNKFEFYAGRRREIFGLVDTVLTSGSYAWSGNALPIPKIQISISEYLPLKFTNNLIALKGGYAHGWFDNQGVIKDFYLHQKWLYTRIGKPNWKVKMYAGFNHQVQWGGMPTIPIPSYDLTGKITYSSDSYPSSFKDYLYAVSGFSLNNLNNGQPNQYSSTDAFNRVGNHLGSLDIGFEINTSHYNLLLYRQNVYDTGALFYLANMSDGLNGISFTNTNIRTKKFILRKITFEWLKTTDQGGSLFYEQISQLRGNNNYFNHGQYLDGWSYFKNTIGTPFITPYPTTLSSLPVETLSIPNNNYNLLFNNNRVNMLFCALQAEGEKLAIMAKFSYSRNDGTYTSSFTPVINQFSSLIKISSQQALFANKYIPSLQLSWDQGGLYPNSFGIYAGLRRIFTP